jgi:exopolysaccharide biosynthesis polyprenyl glycosylphosphotransferase
VLLSLALDAVAVFIALITASWLKFHSGLFPDSSAVSWSIVYAGAVGSIFFWWCIFASVGAYRLHWDRSWTDELTLVFKPVTAGFILFTTLSFLVSTAPSVGRWIFFIYFGLMLVCVFLSRTASRLIQRKYAREGRLYRNAAIVGTGSRAENLYNYLTVNPALGYKIVGFVRAPRIQGEQVIMHNILGDVDQLRNIISDKNIDELLVTIASNFHDDILVLLLPAAGASVRVKVLPDLFDVVAGHVHNTQIFGQPLMEILPERLSFWQRLVKTIGDYLISIVVIVAGLPFWIALSLAIVIDSRGPVFYRQERVSKGGHVYRIFKFRSMVHDAEKHSGAVWAGRNDRRITRVGNFIRKARLDEIPQFLNVLRGEMSVVGPRPERPEFVDELKKVYPFYSKRLTIKPGITGWAQVKLEYDTSIEDVADKLKYDFYYIENQSLFLDIEILIRTISVIVSGSGAH